MVPCQMPLPHLPMLSVPPAKRKTILEQAEAALRDVEESLRAPNVKKYDLEELIGSDGPPKRFPSISCAMCSWS